MSVGKEAIVALEKLARRQGRICPGACDEGVWETPEVARRIRAALAELRELEGGTATRGDKWVVRVEVTRFEPLTKGVPPCYGIVIRAATWAAATAGM